MDMVRQEQKAAAAHSGLREPNNCCRSELPFVTLCRRNALEGGLETFNIPAAISGDDFEPSERVASQAFVIMHVDGLIMLVGIITLVILGLAIYTLNAEWFFQD